MEEKPITNLCFDVNEAIRPDVIERVWLGIKRQLAADGYAVERIQMPKISAWTLDSSNLRKAWEVTSSTQALSSTEKIEYGVETESKKWSACTFPSDAEHQEGKWAVLVYQEMRPIRRRLRRELLHIWESLLALQWGALTEKYQPAD